MTTTRLILAIALSLTLGQAVAQPPATEPDPIQEEIEAVLLRLADAGQLPGPDSEPLFLQASAQTRYDLGAVADVSASDGRGIPLLAVSPGGAAERIGLRTGDRLLAINEIDFRQGATAYTLRDAIAQGDGLVKAEVERDGRVLTVTGDVDAVQTPGYELRIEPAAGDSNCGRLSVFASMPRSERLFPLVLLQVDGREPGPRGATYRVKPGKRVLKISEAIHSDEFTSSQNHQRNVLNRRYAHFKFMDLDVQPGITYHLAARLIRDRPFDILGNAYWEPVVWRKTAHSCR